MCNIFPRYVIIGISGATCSGKTTLATQLKEQLPNCTVISQDDYFLHVDDPRHQWIPELNHINFDILSSLDMEKMTRDIFEFRKNKVPLLQFQKRGRKPVVLDNLCSLIQRKSYELDVHILIIEGFCIFNYEPVASLCALKFYFLLSREECEQRRNLRVYEPPDCPGYFDKCAWPEHLKQLEEVRKNVHNVTYFDENSSNVLEKVLKHIASFMVD